MLQSRKRTSKSSRTSKSQTKNEPKAKKKKVVDVIKDVNFLEKMKEYIKKQLPAYKGDNQIEESVREELERIPDIPGCNDMISLKRLLLTLRIEYSKDECPLFQNNDATLLQTYATDISETNLGAILNHYNLKNDQYHSILKSLIPPKLRVYGEHTEMQNTTTHFCPLFELTLLSHENLEVNSNKQIPELLNKDILASAIAKDLSEFQLDGILVQSLNNDQDHITKIIREDKRDFYLTPFDHPDFLRLIFVMRLALSQNVRLLVKEKPEPDIHNNLFVLGMTTENTQTNLYSLKATVEWESFTVSYKLYTIGSFRHAIINERAKLVDIILQSFTIIPSELLNKYLKSSKAIKKKPQTRIYLTNLNACIDLKEKLSSGLLCESTESLWKGSLVAGVNSYEVICKDFKSNTNDALISDLNCLSLFLAMKGQSIILLKGEEITTISEKDEIEKFMSDLIVQLIYLKAKKIIHNDLKPSNIVKYDGHYFIIDYGLSIQYFSESGEVCKDFDDKIIKSTAGSPTYDPPEKKSGLVSSKTDIYSLGCCFEEIISFPTDCVMDTISNMKVPNVKDRWSIVQCVNFMKSTFDAEFTSSKKFFADKDKYRNAIFPKQNLEDQELVDLLQ